MRAPVVPHPCQDLVLSVFLPCDTWMSFSYWLLRFVVFSCGAWREACICLGVRVAIWGQLAGVHSSFHHMVLEMEFRFSGSARSISTHWTILPTFIMVLIFVFYHPVTISFSHVCPEFYVFLIYPGKKSSVRHILPVFSPVVMQGRCILSFGALGCLFRFMVHFEFIVLIFRLFVCKMA